jgi:hypothetical protein
MPRRQHTARRKRERGGVNMAGISLGEWKGTAGSLKTEPVKGQKQKAKNSIS